MVLQMIKYNVFANDSYVNNESVTPVRLEFWRHVDIHQNQAVPFRPLFPELMNFVKGVH